jgi:hypothetical protein
MIDCDKHGPGQESLTIKNPIRGDTIVCVKCLENSIVSKGIRKILSQDEDAKQFRRQVAVGLNVPPELVLPDEELTDEERARKK